MPDKLSYIMSVATSKKVSETMRPAYIECLKRYLQTGLLHHDELNLLKQEIRRYDIEVHQYDKPAAFRFLGRHESTHKKDAPLIKKRESSDSDSNNVDAIIKNLRAKGKKAVASRDKWRKEAEEAKTRIRCLEDEIIQLKKNANCNDSKFKILKKRFSKMYHPDNLQGERFERLIKQEIFKEFWQEIESIEKQI